MTNSQGGLGEEVGVDRVLHMDQVHAVAPGADDPQAAGACSGQQARHEVRVAHAPDEMGTQSHRAELRRIRGQHVALGEGLGQRVWARAGGRERQRLVHPGEVASVVDDARRARVDEATHAVLAATLDDCPSAKHVGAEEIVVAAPHADFGGGVENRLDAGAGGAHSDAVFERRPDKTYAPRFEVGRRCTTEHGNPPALRQQALDETPAEKAGAASDEDGSKFQVASIKYQDTEG